MAERKKRTLTVGDLARVMETIAPLSLAQDWDNVGLLVGDRLSVCKRVLLCIDMTPAVLTEAKRERFDVVVAYHPLLFRPIGRVLADSDGTDALVHGAIAAGIAVYSPHTALDAAVGGANDVLAGLCRLKNVGPFEYGSGDKGESKVVTFVPGDRVDTLASAMFEAGAGRIGDYEQCSYRINGQGTFFGTESTDPKVGQKGRLERVAEVRLEIVAPDRVLPEVIAALRKTHPYEEPAFDVYPLKAEPTVGIGRVGTLPTGTTLNALASRLKRATKSKVVMTVGDGKAKLTRAAVCVGAAGRLPLERPRSADCDVIVTGEIRHHDALTILRAGKTAIALGHWESERPMLTSLAERLVDQLPRVMVKVSDADVGPFERA